MIGFKHIPLQLTFAAVKKTHKIPFVLNILYVLHLYTLNNKHIKIIILMKVMENKQDLVSVKQ